MPGHPWIPLLHLAGGDSLREQEADIRLDRPEGDPLEDLLDLLSRTLSGQYTPAAARHGWAGFQVSRGELGVSF